MSMQQYQMCETLEEKEHKRWLAHRDAALQANFPTILGFNGVDVPLFKWKELEALGPKTLKQRALNLRDLVESTRSNFFPHHPQLVLNQHLHPDALAHWIIDVQVTLAAAVGESELDHAAFGVALKATAPHQQQQQQRRPEPPWSQQNHPHDVHPHGRRPSPERQPPAWSQHGIAGVDNARFGVEVEVPLSHRTPGGWRQQPPAHQGFSLVPPHLASGGHHGRTDDAAFIRHRGQASSFVFG